MTAAGGPRLGTLILAAGGVVFALLATLNCGGYRYGVGDQAAIWGRPVGSVETGERGDKVGDCGRIDHSGAAVPVAGEGKAVPGEVLRRVELERNDLPVLADLPHVAAGGPDHEYSIRAGHERE